MVAVWWQILKNVFKSRFVDCFLEHCFNPTSKFAPLDTILILKENIKFSTQYVVYITLNCKSNETGNLIVQCRKKHSYVCPLFEATGTCPDRSTCKLHHPKRQTKGRKRKRSEGKNNDQGRYFGSKNHNVSGSRMVVTEKQHPVKSNEPFLEGDLTDYISLDVSSEEDIAESHDSTSQTTSFCPGYLPELLLDDPDELIKPVRVMNENQTGIVDKLS